MWLWKWFAKKRCRSCSCLPSTKFLGIHFLSDLYLIEKNYALISTRFLCKNAKTSDLVLPRSGVLKRIFYNTWLKNTHSRGCNIPISCPLQTHTSDLNYYLDLRKAKAVPLQAWSGPEGSRNLRFPEFMTMAHNGGKVVSLTHRPP